MIPRSVFRAIQGLLERMFDDVAQDQLILLEIGPDRPRTRFPDVSEAMEWTRVSVDEISEGVDQALNSHPHEGRSDKSTLEFTNTPGHG